MSLIAPWIRSRLLLANLAGIFAGATGLSAQVPANVPVPAGFERNLEAAVARVREKGAGPTLISDPLIRGLAANPGNLEAGRVLFNANCVACHLENLRGKAGNAAVVGADLTDNIWDHGSRAADIFTTVMNGSLDTGMPPWKDVLGEEKVALVVSYVLSRVPIVETPISAANAAHNAKLKEWAAGWDAIPRPATGEPPRLAYFPLRLPGGELLEALGVIYADGRVLVYDERTFAPHSVWTDATILRDRAAIRGFRIEGTKALTFTGAAGPLALARTSGDENATSRTLVDVARRNDGIEIRSRASFASGAAVSTREVLALTESNSGATLQRALTFEGIPAGAAVTFAPGAAAETSAARAGVVQTGGQLQLAGDRAKFTPGDGARSAGIEWTIAVASVAEVPAAAKTKTASFEWDAGPPGPLTRPGFRAVQHPLPRLPSGEHRVLPFAMTTDPVTGTVYVSSGKLGEIFQVQAGPQLGSVAKVTEFTGAYLQDVLAMHHDGRSLLVQNRRHLTRVVTEGGQGVGPRLEHVMSFPQLIEPKSYDWGYGLVPDKNGGYIVSFAGHAVDSQAIKGSGSALRITPDAAGGKVEEVAFGMRNPVGWTVGPDGDIFFTDNQGNWMASNRLSQLVPDRYYGFPNPKQLEHRSKPVGPTAVWVPYAWAKSINGVTYNNTGAKFGPFAGHFFLAEVMEGGAIIRAQLEKVKGQYQGACFPFWNRGLLGPVSLTFDPTGRLWVGGLTEPGWMRQPDRGALYSIEYTGQVPFEIESIHARPDGFRIRFTQVPNRRAAEAVLYRIEHYRYEYSSAYGSRELDRTAVPVRSVTFNPEGRDVDLVLPPLVKGRVYRFDFDLGITSEKGEPLANDRAAYTLNEIPDATK